jgi:methylase of polypeptide subunit release factors
VQPREVSEADEHMFSLHSFDYIIGNPPWVNWEHLPENYRRTTMPLWQHYGLFPKRERGMETILGGAKYDFSMLLTCVALDRYLKDNGKLGFVITESLFKTTEAGQGFRRFLLPDKTPFKPVLVENMANLKPFEKALNRTTLAVFQKGKHTTYPIPYSYWSKAASQGRVRIDFDSDYDSFPYEKIIVHDWEAQPVDPKNLTSIWITGRPNAIRAIPRLLGESNYSAREGTNTGGANGVYWVKESGEQDGDLVQVFNLCECSKKSVTPRKLFMEKDLLYPLLRAGNVRRWQAQPDSSIIITHEPDAHLRAISEAFMQDQYPKTYEYLLQFEAFLRQRKTQVVRNLMRRGPFYSIFGIGEYSFSTWKVVWTRIAKVEAAVAGIYADKPMIPQETLTMVECQTEGEAHFLAAAINSTPFQFTVNAYSQRGGKSMGSKHILKYIHIPAFDPNYMVHQEMAYYSQQAHQAVLEKNYPQLAEIEQAIDQTAAKLWELTDLELQEIKQSFVDQ